MKLVETRSVAHIAEVNRRHEEAYYCKASVSKVRIPDHPCSELKTHFDELDSVRGVAALTVVLHHFKEVWQHDATIGLSPMTLTAIQCAIAPFTSGRQAVILFFILSGFVLSIPAVNLRAQVYPVFITRRVFRIYMPYLVALVLAVLGSMIFYNKPLHSEWLNLAWSTPVDWHLVLKHVLFVGEYDTNQFNPPIWSLVEEMRISLVFPVLCALALRLRPRHSLIMAACLSALSIIGTNSVHLGRNLNSFIGTVHYMAFFIVGIYLARRKEAISIEFGNLAKPARVIFAILSALCYLSGVHMWDVIAERLRIHDAGHLTDWPSALGAAGLVVVSLNSATCRRVLHWRAIHALGKMSYSIYLLHFVILLLLAHLLYNRIPLAMFISICLVVVIGASWASYRFVEIPCINLGRKLSGYL